MSYNSRQRLPAFSFVSGHMWTYSCTLCIDQSLLALKSHHYSSALAWCLGMKSLSSTSFFHPPGEISTRTTLDREQQSSYQLVMVVQDGGSPPRSATGTAFITVLDDNDNDPAFIHSQAGKHLIIQVMPRRFKRRQAKHSFSFMSLLTVVCVLTHR